ncbi:MAG: hypothetical protein ACTSU2_06700 [Promethearchaeota archaeon]
MEIDFQKALAGLKESKCPYCHRDLSYDVQIDSIYVMCKHCNFTLSTFLDKYNGDFLLYFINNGLEGVIDREQLRQLQKVILRNSFVKKKLFSLKIATQIL